MLVTVYRQSDKLVETIPPTWITTTTKDGENAICALQM